jgi:xylan 1,4-beta-xylosidase
MADTAIVVHADCIQGSCPHFWQAAGDDDAYEWTFKPGGEYLLDEIRRTGCIRYFRNHHALSKPIQLPNGHVAQAYTEDARGNPIYDFSGIEAVYRRWLAAGVRPIVELDYLPAPLRDEHRLPKGGDAFWLKWRGLLRAFLRHLKDTFGGEELRKWYFEDWNEPDWWPRERLGEFWRLHDEAAAAVAEVDPQLVFGGPAAYTEYFAEAFMHHITHGLNQVTGKTGSRCDYISFHAYAVSGNTLAYHPAMAPHPQDIAARVYWLWEAFQRYPGLLKKELHLNEWGVVSHYQKTSRQFPPLELRNTEYSALFMIKLVHLLFTLADNRGSFLPSLMLYWGGAYECDVGLFAGNRALVTKYCIAKPILRAFQLLAKLGDIRLGCDGAPAGSAVSLLPTYGDGELRLLAYHCYDVAPPLAAPATVDITVTGLCPDGPATVQLSRLDRDHANACRAWERLGKPENPSDRQILFLKAQSELTPSSPMPVTIAAGVLKFQLDIPAQGAVLATLRLDQGKFVPPDKGVQQPDAPRETA